MIATTTLSGRRDCRNHVVPPSRWPPALRAPSRRNAPMFHGCCYNGTNVPWVRSLSLDGGAAGDEILGVGEAPGGEGFLGVLAGGGGGGGQVGGGAGEAGGRGGVGDAVGGDVGFAGGQVGVGGGFVEGQDGFYAGVGAGEGGGPFVS